MNNHLEWVATVLNRKLVPVSRNLELNLGCRCLLKRRINLSTNLIFKDSLTKLKNLNLLKELQILETGFHMRKLLYLKIPTALPKMKSW